MIYAFSRDGALPGSKHWHKINRKTRTPTNSVWLGVTISAIVGATSLYVRGSGAGRILDGVLRDDRDLCDRSVHRLRDPDLPSPDQPRFQTRAVEPQGIPQAGRLDGAHLDRCFITILFFSPLFSVLADLGDSGDEIKAFHRQHFTGRPLILLAVHRHVALLVGCLSAKKWFKGPKVQGTKEELLAIERELDALG